MDKKFILFALTLCSVGFAQQSVSQALNDLCSTTKAFFGAGIVIFAVLAIPLIAIGLFLYFKKKENKTLGIAMAVIGVAAPVLLVIIYLLIPVIISALIGVGPPINC